ncbi:hypothetical protein NDU88_009303 [Pleurodeles waltl]|uniref:Uncharacterized protein n=1 Tax=Pleurodeles waltl TaxID=8319 RepID=A0AAV7QUT5_PLEWA|nr:hypothetical protein NDU88_009303 [Pleurodeles waltl]
MPQGKSTKASSGATAKETSLIPFDKRAYTNQGLLNRDNLFSSPRQAYMDNFLSELSAKIGSLKKEFKSCIHEIKRNIDDLGERVNDMERTEDQRLFIVGYQPWKTTT